MYKMEDKWKNLLERIPKGISSAATSKHFTGARKLRCSV
jgi:hypothetical protein